jgi:hypothetical protein
VSGNLGPIVRGPSQQARQEPAHSPPLCVWRRQARDGKSSFGDSWNQQGGSNSRRLDSFDMRDREWGHTNNVVLSGKRIQPFRVHQFPDDSPGLRQEVLVFVQLLQSRPCQSSDSGSGSVAGSVAYRENTCKDIQASKPEHYG